MRPLVIALLAVLSALVAVPAEAATTEEPPPVTMTADEEATLAEDEPATLEKDAARSFEAMQRELATSEARLISLGVELPSGRAGADALPAEEAEEAKRDAKPQRERGGTKKTKKKPGAGAGSSSGLVNQKPGARPSSPPGGGRSDEAPRPAPTAGLQTRDEPELP